MKAVTLDSLDTPPALREDVPEPTPVPEVLVRVGASSVNPADNHLRWAKVEPKVLESPRAIKPPLAQRAGTRDADQ
jgi:NADPH:quinone reductase-like Zn-dependent oxidoreductase